MAVDEEDCRGDCERKNERRVGRAESCDRILGRTASSTNSVVETRSCGIGAPLFTGSSTLNATRKKKEVALRVHWLSTKNGDKERNVYRLAGLSAVQERWWIGSFSSKKLRPQYSQTVRLSLLKAADASAFMASISFVDILAVPYFVESAVFFPEALEEEEEEDAAAAAADDDDDECVGDANGDEFGTRDGSRGSGLRSLAGFKFSLATQSSLHCFK